MNLLLTIVIHKTFFPSIRFVDVTVSYHCSISVAFALLSIPRMSYISWSSSFIFFTGIGVCLGNRLSAISTIFKSGFTLVIEVSASCIAPTLYLSALTFSSPSFVYASLMNGYIASVSSISQSAVNIIGFSCFISLYLLYMSSKFVLFFVIAVCFWVLYRNHCLLC